MNVRLIVVALVLGSGGSVLAQSSKPKPSAPSLGGATVSNKDAGTPTAPELDQLQMLVGTWRCDGSISAGPLGPARKYQANATVTRVLDGRWYEIQYEQQVSKDNPTPQ